MCQQYQGGQEFALTTPICAKAERMMQPAVSNQECVDPYQYLSRLFQLSIPMVYGSRGGQHMLHIADVCSATVISSSRLIAQPKQRGAIDESTNRCSYLYT